MKEGSFLSVAFYVAWRNLRVLFRSPALLLPSILFPLFFLIAFTGALSSVTQVKSLDIPNYTGFQFVFALMQAAGFTGAMGGIAMLEDFENGFIRRLMLTARHRSAIVVGFTSAMLIRFWIAGAFLTGVAFILGMKVSGNALDIVAMYGLASLLNIATSLWAAGIAMHFRSNQAAPAMALPIFLLLFLSPVYVPLDGLKGWLHAVAVANPLSYFMEAGRGFLFGDPVYVLPAFGAAVGMSVVFALWAVRGVRVAEAAGG